MSSLSLTDLEKAILQIILSWCLIENSVLEEKIQRIKSDFPQQIVLPVSQIFSKINRNIREFSLEIKTILKINENGDRLSYHGNSLRHFIFTATF
jgi:hypothetical protein